MKIVVLKFGGTSVGTTNKIKELLKLLLITKRKLQSNCTVSDEWCDK